MKTSKLLATLFCFGLLCSAVAPTAKADAWDKKTIVTFSGPVDASGTRLEPGTYVFKLMDSQADRHIVQIFNSDESHLITTILALPNYRITPTSKSVIKFSETWERPGEVNSVSRSLPEAGIPIKEWFYPGDNFGQEFPGKPAPVMVAEATAVQDTKQQTAQAAPAPEPAPAPAPEEKKTEVAAVQPAPAPAPQAQEQPAPQPAAPAELPKTASPMPLIGLIGLLSLGAGASLRLIAKRLA